MSGGPNVETMRRLIDAYARGDLDSMLAHVDRDVEIHPLPEMGDEPYRGHEGIRRFVADSRRWDEMTFRPQRLVENGECVAILGRYRSRRGGAIHDSPAAFAATLRDGKLVRSESFLSWDDALERCGVRDTAETPA